ncbi:MAG: hypothetical protein CV087_19940 [Candidatus Brocadia sp. WS118]|nr:MAG: hypothetical protein CV087_19940 [Candidatus Brocadia sp. WS118]
MKKRIGLKQNSKLVKMLSACTDNKGMVFIIVLGLLATLALVGTTSVVTTTTDMKISNNYQSSTQAFYTAEGGAKYGVEKLRQKLKTVLNPSSSDLSSITAPTITDYNFHEFSVSKVGVASTKEITTGSFTDLTAVIQKYEIVSEAKRDGNNSSAAKVVQSVEDNLIPLFQFGIFYQDDLEIVPGQNMIFSGGRIHSNSNIYLGSDGTNKSLSIDSKITSAGNIYNHRKDTGTVTSGTVQIKDGAGNYQAMKISGIILDSDNSDWVTESINRWNGKVKSTDHGIIELDLPLPQGDESIEVIKKGDTIDPEDSTEPEELLNARYYWKAGLRIIDGIFYDRSGDIIDITNGGTVTTPLSTHTIYDAREGNNITIRTINLLALGTNTVAINALNDPPAGILYISESGSNKAVRLTDGSSLPTGGLTVASENPVYIQGNYNLDNKPASVAGDAVTILSNAWNDANSNNTLNNRVASDTTVKTVIMAGHVATNGTQYSGGVENFPRFLEKWSGKTFTYSGSLISIWQSEKATGTWKYGSPVYEAPTRVWSYGIDFNNLPPGTPIVRMVQRVGWQQDLN